MEWSKTPITAEEATKRIECLPEFLRPIKEAAGAIASKSAWIEDHSGAILAGHYLDMGLIDAHDLVLFPPISREILRIYEKVNDFSLPDILIEFLAHLNGCNIFDLRIYGAPASMARNPPTIDRSRCTPLDISSGRHWRVGYALASEDDLLFASKNVGDDGQIGYFITPAGLVIGRGNGSPEVDERSGPWSNVTDWLASEIGQVR
ncbi:SMI1/KNR4 family protein [Sphingomonas lycopersici]|uniref:SMI1/KNR4 family protein n=1 Tax=Sphingomonas lycopersici TaxID=2951807 RepID=A0AA41ZG61_9SPHN|nr:SMI1/KNR4 family protein [Sphingomonas lycopersici]MCW6536289.1 SMI1/KNR4 family protein [Sphingomonas lycopersici]